MLSKDEIIRMAREVWGERAVLPFNELERFAALVAAHEREACANVCDKLAEFYPHTISTQHCAASIRERGSK